MPNPISVAAGVASFDTALIPLGALNPVAYGRTAEGTLLTSTALVSVQVAPPIAANLGDITLTTSDPDYVIDLDADVFNAGGTPETFYLSPANRDWIVLDAVARTVTIKPSLSGAQDRVCAITGYNEGGQDTEGFPLVITLTPTTAVVANDDTASVPAGDHIVINALENDTGGGAAPLSITAASADIGTVSIGPDPDYLLDFDATGLSEGQTATITYTLTDGATTDTGTITVTIGSSSSYVIAPGDFDTALDAAEVADDGRTLLLAPGDHSPQLLNNKNYQFENRVTVKSQDPANPALSGEIDIRTSDNLTFEGIRHADVMPTPDGIFIALVNGSGSTYDRRIIVKDAVLAPPPGTPITRQDVIDAGLDPIMNTPNIYKDTMLQYGVTTMGGSYAGKHIEVRGGSLKGCQDLVVAKMPDGGTIDLIGIDFGLAYGDMVKFVESPTGHPARSLLIGCYGWNPLASITDDADPSTTSTGGIHVDGVQLQGDGTNATDWTGVEIYATIFHWTNPDDDPSVPRGKLNQPFFEDDHSETNGTYITGLRAIGNIGRTDARNVMGPARGEAKECVYLSNTALVTGIGTNGGYRYDRQSFSTIGNETSVGPHVHRFTVAEAFTEGGTTTDAAWRAANFNHLLPQTAAGYEAAFVGNATQNWICKTKAEVLATFKPKPGGPLDPGRGIYIGAIAPDSVALPWIDWNVDYSTGDVPTLIAATVDHPAEEDGFNPAGLFTDATGITSGATATSNKVQVSGVSATGVLVEIEGGNAPTVAVYQSDGTTVRWPHGGACIAFDGDWIEVRDTSPGTVTIYTGRNAPSGALSDTWTIST